MSFHLNEYNDIVLTYVWFKKKKPRQKKKKKNLNLYLTLTCTCEWLAWLTRTFYTLKCVQNLFWHLVKANRLYIACRMMLTDRYCFWLQLLQIWIYSWIDCKVLNYTYRIKGYFRQACWIQSKFKTSYPSDFTKQATYKIFDCSTWEKE